MADEVITVDYAFVDGAHMFTSDDKFACGLLVGHQDLKTAFEETAIQLKTLLKLNHDIETEVESLVTFEEFAALVASVPKPTNPHVRPRLKSEVDWHRKAA
ncbi:hypothetical protein SAMN05216360_108108 [Methylobacterium phyllostachyos]|uniref:Uncharacterized protein n=1 Tax=Methylobacterium phyllostachyos TaxID=582672 RepID=A0A1H0BB44_9HYPH|nr:hypothetical protein [Methylobacterium phyllostachyos]SDN42821.1 hypothetical protein SAMN05216360_108108 [Methylobacterium phyllostachyos]